MFKRLFSPKRPPFRWDNPKEWHDVIVQSADKENIYFGHRINISNLNEEQRDQIRIGLTKKNIAYSERQATKKSEGIEVGDWTIRVSDPKSIEALRNIDFRWATYFNIRPVSIRKKDFDRQQQIRELSARESISVSTNSHPQNSEKINQQIFLKQKTSSSNRS